MDTNRLMWWIVGGLAMLGVAYVTYLFVLAPLPPRFKQDWTAEAKLQLSRICDLETAFHQKRGVFATSLDSLGYYQAKNDGGKYWIELEKGDSASFVARAYAREDFDADGLQSVWEIGRDCNPKELQAD